MTADPRDLVDAILTAPDEAVDTILAARLPRGAVREARRTLSLAFPTSPRVATLGRRDLACLALAATALGAAVRAARTRRGASLAARQGAVTLFLLGRETARARRARDARDAAPAATRRQRRPRTAEPSPMPDRPAASRMPPAPDELDALIDAILAVRGRPAAIRPMRQALTDDYPRSQRIAELGDQDLTWLGLAASACLEAMDGVRSRGDAARVATRCVLVAYVLGRQAGQLALLPAP